MGGNTGAREDGVGLGAGGEGCGVGGGVRKGGWAEEGHLRHRMLLEMPLSSGVLAISADSWAPGNQFLSTLPGKAHVNKS